METLAAAAHSTGTDVEVRALVEAATQRRCQVNPQLPTLSLPCTVVVALVGVKGMDKVGLLMRPEVTADVRRDEDAVNPPEPPRARGDAPPSEDWQAPAVREASA